MRTKHQNKTSGAMSPAERYSALCDDFLGRTGVSPSTKKLFASSALTAGGRIFAMLTRDRLVVKLPKARVDTLILEGWGERFDANRGTPMKEWLTIDPAHEENWASLAGEALAFALSMRSVPRPRRRS